MLLSSGFPQGKSAKRRGRMRSSGASVGSESPGVSAAVAFTRRGRRSPPFPGYAWGRAGTWVSFPGGGSIGGRGVLPEGAEGDGRGPGGGLPCARAGVWERAKEAQGGL